jgi:hypothetical protein
MTPRRLDGEIMVYPESAWLEWGGP